MPQISIEGASLIYLRFGLRYKGDCARCMIGTEYRQRKKLKTPASSNGSVGTSATLSERSSADRAQCDASLPLPFSVFS